MRLFRRYRPRHKHTHRWVYTHTSIAYVRADCACGEWDLA